MTTQFKKIKRAHLVRDLLIIAASISLAIWLSKSSAMEALLARTASMPGLAALIAGLFYSSVFTTAPAMVALAHLAKANSVVQTALFGAGGALLGDLIIFKFVRTEIAQNLQQLTTVAPDKRFAFIFHLKLFRWMSPLIGALLIASPLPDELGVFFLGLTKVRTVVFMPLTFIFHFFGIAAVGLMRKII